MNSSPESPLCTSWVTRADYLCRSTVTQYLKASLPPPLSLQAFGVFKYNWCLPSDLLNKEEMVYCDLTLKLPRCRGETWIGKSRGEDTVKVSRCIYIWRRKMYCSNIYVASFPLRSKKQMLRVSFSPVSLVLLWPYSFDPEFKRG